MKRSIYIKYLPIILGCINFFVASTCSVYGVVKINPPGNFVTSEPQISPDSSRALFGMELGPIPAGPFTYPLFNVPIQGGAPINLTVPMLGPGQGLFGFSSFSISPDGTRVVYTSDQDTNEVFELYSVPISGGTITKLNPVLTADGDVNGFQISPNSQWVFFDAITNTTKDLWRVPIDGPSPALRFLNITDANAAIVSYQISPNSSNIVILGDNGINNDTILLSFFVDNGMLSGIYGIGPMGGQGPQSFQISPDSQRVVHIGDNEINDQFELYSSPMIGLGNTNLNPDLPVGGDINNFQISSDSQTVVYLGDQFQDNVVELYSIPIIGAGGITNHLNTTPVANGDVLNFQIISNGTRVIYRADQDTDSTNELYSVPIAGGAVVKLNPPLATLGDVSATFISSSDSIRVVYIADQEKDGFSELFSVPVAGGTATKLNGNMIVDGDVSSFRISPDNNRVVYRADQNSDEVLELFSVPITGGASVKLNAPFFDPYVISPDVNTFVISPDSQRVVYTGDWDTEGIEEVYSVGITGDGTGPGGGGGSGGSEVADFNGDGLGDVLLQKKTALSILTRSGSNATFSVTALGSALEKGRKVIAANELTGDNQPEIIVKKGKTYSVLTVTTDLTTTASSYSLPTLSKGFKIVASGKLGTNGVVVAAKGKLVNILGLGSPITWTNSGRYKVFGLGVGNNGTALFAQKGKNLSQIPITGTSNGYSFGAVAASGSVPKGNKIVGLGKVLGSNGVDVIIQKAKTVQALTAPNYSSPSSIGEVSKGQKVVGPK